MSFETTTEKVWKERVTVITEGLQYVEFGIDFIRFRLGEKLFEVKIKERTPKKIDLSYSKEEIKRINKKYDKKK